MTTKTKFILAVALIIILAVGFFVGQSLFEPPTKISGEPIKSPFETLTASNTKAPQKPVHQITDKIYIVSPPSTGVIWQTKPLQFKDINKNLIVMTIPTHESQGIELNQGVLLYDSQNNLLNDVIGKITSILDYQDEKKITITFYGVDPTLFKNIHRGEIVLNVERGARLPHSALVMDKQGKSFYWEIDTISSAATAHIKPAIITQKNLEFFVVKPEFGSSNIFILNPDEKLKDGSQIKISKILYQGPRVTTDQALMKKIRKDINNKNKKMREDHMFLQIATQSLDPSNPNNAGCGAAPEISEAPDEIVVNAPDAAPVACLVDESLSLPLLDAP